MSEDDEGSTGSVGMNRTLALSDGVFAIAMTLLAFQLQPPEINGPAAYHLVRALGAMGNRYYVYILSFLVIGVLWLAHHRLFSLLRRVDEVLMLLNVVFLMAVAVLPFPTAVLGRYGNQAAAVVLYAAVMAAAGILLTSLLLLARHRSLLSAAATPERVRLGLWRSGSMAAVFALSIPVALVAPRAAPYTWLLVFGVRFVARPRRRARVA